MATKLERLERANAELQRELRERESEVKRLAVRSSLDRDAKKSQSLEQRLKEAYRDCEQLEGELVSSKELVNKLQYEVDILRGVVQLRDHPELLRVADAEVRARKTERELRSVKEELVATTEKSRVYLEGCTKVGKEADALRHKCHQLQEELERQSHDMKALLAEREGLLRDTTDACESADEMRAQVSEYAEQRAKLMDLAREKDKQLREVANELEECKQDELHARRTWEEGHRQLEAARAKLKECEAERDSMSTKFRLLSEEEQTNARRYDSLMRSAEALRSENRQMREQLAAWQTRAEEIDVMGRRLSVADAEHGKTQQQIASLEEQCVSLQQKLHARERECEHLSDELATARDDVKVQVEQMNVLSRNLMGRLESLEIERDHLLHERDSLAKELATSQEKASTLSVLMMHHQALSRTALSSAATSGTAVSERLSKLLQEKESYSKTSPPRGQQMLQNSSDIALSPPTPLPHSAAPIQKDHQNPPIQSYSTAQSQQSPNTTQSQQQQLLRMKLQRISSR